VPASLWACVFGYLVFEFQSTESPRTNSDVSCLLFRSWPSSILLFQGASRQARKRLRGGRSFCTISVYSYRRSSISGRNVPSSSLRFAYFLVCTVRRELSSGLYCCHSVHCRLKSATGLVMSNFFPTAIYLLAVSLKLALTTYILTRSVLIRRNRLSCRWSAFLRRHWQFPSCYLLCR
jgi:hypothetical protein